MYNRCMHVIVCVRLPNFLQPQCSSGCHCSRFFSFSFFFCVVVLWLRFGCGRGSWSWIRSGRKRRMSCQAAPWAGPFSEKHCSSLLPSRPSLPNPSLKKEYQGMHLSLLPPSNLVLIFKFLRASGNRVPLTRVSLLLLLLLLSFCRSAQVWQFVQVPFVWAAVYHLHRRPSEPFHIEKRRHILQVLSTH